MQKSELSELIEYLESEKSNLEEQKKECLNYRDYEGAHYVSIALGQVNHQLQTLYNLNDPDYEEKRRLQVYKSIADSRLNEIEDEQLKESYVKMKKEFEGQLQQLSSGARKKSLDGQEFDDAVYDLIEQRIAGFKFHLQQKENLYLDFRLHNKTSMIISSSPLTRLENDYLRGEIKERLPALGFVHNKEKNCMEYFYDLGEFKNSFAIKTLVARIVFDVLYFKELDNPALIEKY